MPPKKYKTAIKCFDNATNLTNDYFNAFYGKGYTYIEMENYREAIDSFNKSINASINASKSAATAAEAAKATGNSEKLDQANERRDQANTDYAKAKEQE